MLFGFLTLPLGTVVRLLGKQSQAGSLEALYKSVEEAPRGVLQDRGLQGDADLRRLLTPRSVQFCSSVFVVLGVDLNISEGCE